MKTIPIKCHRSPWKCYFAIVDDEDYNEMKRFHWHTSGGITPYATRGSSVGGRKITVFMHRVILNEFVREDGRRCDHVNRNSLDNRRENLRPATPSQNSVNWERENRYGRGVYRAAGGQFGAFIYVETRRRYLGSYDAVTKAQVAYDFFARKYHGEFAILNHPEIVLNEPPLPIPIEKKHHFKRSGGWGTGYRGVEHDGRGSSFKARIRNGNVRFYLGAFSTAELAARAYDVKAKELFGKHAILNFPDPEKPAKGGA